MRFEFVGFTLGVECIINTAVVNIAARGAVPPVAPKRTGSGRAPILCTDNRSGILFACNGENEHKYLEFNISIYMYIVH